MSPSTSKVLAEALALPAPARAEIAEALLRSLDDGPDEDPEVVAAAWAEEIERRVADHAAGRSKSVPFEEAMERIRDGLKARREARDR